MKINFRIATLDDIASIVKLCNECFQEDTSLDYATKIFKETMNDENQIYLIGTINDKIIAHTKITIIPTIYENMNTYSILNHICVKEEFRRHHIASKMLDECARISKNHNCITMKLWSNNYRNPAHECYKKYGFIINDAKFFSKEI